MAASTGSSHSQHRHASRSPSSSILLMGSTLQWPDRRSCRWAREGERADQRSGRGPCGSTAGNTSVAPSSLRHASPVARHRGRLPLLPGRCPIARAGLLATTGEERPAVTAAIAGRDPADGECGTRGQFERSDFTPIGRSVKVSTSHVRNRPRFRRRRPRRATASSGPPLVGVRIRPRSRTPSMRPHDPRQNDDGQAQPAQNRPLQRPLHQGDTEQCAHDHVDEAKPQSRTNHGFMYPRVTASGPKVCLVPHRHAG